MPSQIAPSPTSVTANGTLDGRLDGRWNGGRWNGGRWKDGRWKAGRPPASFSERSAIMKWYKHLDCRFRCDRSGVVDGRYINQASNVSFAALTAGSLAEISADERRTTTIRKYWRLFYDFDVEFRAESVIIESLRHDSLRSRLVTGVDASGGHHDHWCLVVWTSECIDQPSSIVSHKFVHSSKLYSAVMFDFATVVIGKSSARRGCEKGIQ